MAVWLEAGSGRQSRCAEGQPTEGRFRDSYPWATRGLLLRHLTAGLRCAVIAADSMARGKDVDCDDASHLGCGGSDDPHSAPSYQRKSQSHLGVHWPFTRCWLWER
jgi:hypothetical protein